ncbi:MAG: N-6 DNA methylase [Spirochaetales bacterium]|nr:N-6 DNA methylase [Spirochaetales bacterium]
MQDITKLEKRLWEAADQLRANSKLTQTEYSMPVLGLIFLRYAYNRFLTAQEEIKKNLPSRGGKTRAITKEDYKGKAALYLPEKSRYDYLLNLPQGDDPSAAVNEAMEAIEAVDEQLMGILPKDYQIFDNDLLNRLLKIFNDEALRKASGDVFGRIYEYFLMNFAMAGAGEKGEFFTPVSLVQTIVNVIEPNHGIVFDPACGSGGMFVQTGHFMHVRGKNPQRVLTFYGQEKTATTIRLARMNLAVHGLEGKIAEANTFYQDEHNLLKKADFVMANPPFNVDGVDAEKVKADPRLPFGLPGVNKKKQVSNGNYLWISYFYSYMNETGRAGFVMSSQASSAGGGEREVRRKLIETGAVDAMIAIRSNFFYTLSVPCELWFLNNDKPEARRDSVLMIDARNTYRMVSRRVYDFSPEQLNNITSIVWLYRGDTKKYLSLIEAYFNSMTSHAQETETAIKQYHDIIREKENETVQRLKKETDGCANDIRAFIKKAGKLTTHEEQKKAYTGFLPVTERLAEARKLLEVSFKAAIEGPDQTRNSKKRKAELEEAHGKALDAIKQTLYFHKQTGWHIKRFPDASLADVPGLVKLVDTKEIAENDYSLTPGRYVGVAPEEEDEDFDFHETIQEIHRELEQLNDDAVTLAEIIRSNFEELGI